MEKSKFRVESGIQLLTRLSTKKTKVENYYPYLFQSSPKSGEVIELFSNRSSSFLLIDMISEALLPQKSGGSEIGVLILNTDGHITLQALTASLQSKLTLRNNFTSACDNYEQTLKYILDNLLILDIFDATQLYTTFQNLDSILTTHNNISLCVIDTLTAFYWSEQSYKITKMDVYLKNLLRNIQKAVQRHEPLVIYTRPGYFNSSKDLLENLEECAECPTPERVNCRVQLLDNEDGMFTVNTMTCANVTRRTFRMGYNQILWL